MMQQFPYKHNIKYNRSKIRALHPKNCLGLNYSDLVIKNNKIIYKLWHNCSSHWHNIEHNRQIF